MQHWLDSYGDIQQQHHTNKLMYNICVLLNAILYLQKYRTGSFTGIR